MLRSMNELKDYAIRATDGDIGHVEDFYFDDKTWVVRYLIVDTGTWLASRKVLISPIAISRSNWTEKMLHVAITRQQVKDSPDIDTDKPVSRQHEMQYLGYYGYPYYWGGAGLWAAGSYPSMMMPGFVSSVSTPHAAQSPAEKYSTRTDALWHEKYDDPNLRSCQEVMSYHIRAADGEIGHVQSFLVDEKTWAIRYLVANTSNWWLGHQTLIAPQWIRDVKWPSAMISVNLTRQAVKDAPPYESNAKLSRKQEMNLYKHYGQAGYWVGEVKSVKPKLASSPGATRAKRSSARISDR
ncbi:MAG: PRC-barrel domain-containing protein [Gammaproteobacteria bacterium]